MSQPNFASDFRVLEMNGGAVQGERPFATAPLQFHLPVTQAGYANAQIDDCVGRRKAYPWRPGTRLKVCARFSHEAEDLVGTAGFGFWNAPFGDPTVPWPTLPQATWFFFGSPPNDLPLAPAAPGCGWFAATLDATTWRAVRLAPLAPAVLLMNQFTSLRQKVWPWVQHNLQISFQPIQETMMDWHDYQLNWGKAGCEFFIDGRLIHRTPFSPRGPLGFVCWMDNQYMVATANGRFRWGTLPVSTPQFLAVDNLHIETIRVGE
ncbi:hypothetical protein [Candidatus Leptofilum sp.]|uniref:hypothetical protein n=1 Tax=Candidatus Leptofilum sp. TaxID=3241576 RepID=UPI003B59C37E